MLESVLHTPKSTVVTARIPPELKMKIDSLNINVSDVVRDSLTEAVEKAEALERFLKPGKPILTEELMKLKPEQRYEAYRDNRLSPESRSAMEEYRRAGLNLWERNQLLKKSKVPAVKSE